MTPFTDDDLRTLKLACEEPAIQVSGPAADFRALLARLEAAENCIEEAKGTGLICCEDVCCEGTAYPIWRKAAGRDK